MEEWSTQTQEELNARNETAKQLAYLRAQTSGQPSQIDDVTPPHMRR